MALLRRLLALTARSLREDSRSSRGHLIRLGLLSVLLFVLSFTTQQVGTSDAPGLELLQGLTHLNAVCLLLAGATFFTQVITEDKEEQTLPLLRMANVGPLALLIGKWMPTMFVAGLLVAVQYPFVQLAVTLGGVSSDQVAAVYKTLFVLLLFSGAVGLLCSVVMPRHSSASMAAILILVGFQVIPWVGQIVWMAWLRGTPDPSSLEWIGTTLAWWHAMSPFRQINSVLNPGFVPVRFFDAFTQGYLILAGLCFVLSWLLFDTGSAEPAGAVADKTPRSQCSHSGRVWSAALCWKEFRLVAGGTTGLLLSTLMQMAVVAGTFALFRIGSGQSSYRISIDDVAQTTLAWLFFLLPLQFAKACVRTYRDELKNQTWSTLTLIPRSLQEVVYGKLLGASLVIVPGLLLGIFAVLVDNNSFPLAELFFGNDAEIAWTVVCQYAMFVHLAVLLGVGTDWAPWPVAIFLSLVSLLLTDLVVVMVSNSELVLLMVSGLAVLGCHFFILKRLAAAAAE